MANERKVMKIEQIRFAETILFWIERLAIFLFVFFGGIPRFLRPSLGLFVFTNLYYASLGYERLFLTPQPKEPSNNLFIFERYASWLALIYFFMGSSLYRYVAAVVFVISNMNLILKFFGVNPSQILNCTSTEDEKEEEIETPQAVEESAEEKTKLNEIEGIPETENIEPEAYDDTEEGATATLLEDNSIMEKELAMNNEEDDGEEDDFEIFLSYKKDNDDVDEDDSDDDGEDDCSSSNDDEEDDSSDDDEEDDSSEEKTKTEETDQENVLDNEEEVKDDELMETEDEYYWEIAKDSYPSMRRQIDLFKGQTQLEGKYCKLVKSAVQKLVVLEQENKVLSRKLRAEKTSTEQLNRLVCLFEIKCERLEDEKADLTASLSIAKDESEFYRECMHNLGLDNELSTI